MALARFALRNVSQRVFSPASSLVGHGVSGSTTSVGGVQRQRWSDELLKRFRTTCSDKVGGETSSDSDGKEVAVNYEGGKKSKLFPKKKGNRGGLWRSDGREFVPALHEFFPSGLGNALFQATENINRLLQNLNVSPSNLIGRFKEKDECYKLRYEVPGLSKEDLKMIIDDGVLTIKGEHKEEGEEGSDDEYWSMKGYGYYNTSILLPDDAKADDIEAELKDGVLYITIPRTEKPKKDVKEVKIQ